MYVAAVREWSVAGIVWTSPGGPMGSGLTHSADLSDDIVFGHVYDQKVVGRFAAYIKKYKISAFSL